MSSDPRETGEMSGQPPRELGRGFISLVHSGPGRVEISTNRIEDAPVRQEASGERGPSSEEQARDGREDVAMEEVREGVVEATNSLRPAAVERTARTAEVPGARVKRLGGSCPINAVYN